jgi:hypothetical protein
MTEEVNYKECMMECMMECAGLKWLQGAFNGRVYCLACAITLH